MKVNNNLIRGELGEVVNLSTYAYSISAYFPAFASFLPRMTDLLTAGTEIFSLRASIDPPEADLGFLYDICEPEQKIVPVGIVLEYSPSVARYSAILFTILETVR